MVSLTTLTYNRRVKGLRTAGPDSKVRILSAATGAFLREEKATYWEKITQPINDKKNMRNRKVYRRL